MELPTGVGVMLHSAMSGLTIMVSTQLTPASMYGMCQGWGSGRGCEGERYL